MSALGQRRHSVDTPVAAPGNAATIILANWSSVPKVPTGAAATVNPVEKPRDLPTNDVVAVELVWIQNDQASAANGVRLYALASDKTTFREVDCKDDNGIATIGSAAPQAVPVLSAGQERRILVVVARYPFGGVIEYTAGATGPTNWDVLVTYHLNDGGVLQ